MDKRTLLFMLCVSLAFFGVHAYFDKYGEKPAVERRAVVQNARTPAPLIAQNNRYEPQPSTGETFYVLENGYQQLVFSSKGGSLAEINLPLRTTNPDSFVKEIDFDREILRTSPQNARFPLHPYLTPGGEQKEGKLGGYYPLLRRGIDGKTLDGQYYAFSVVGDDPAIANAAYRMTRFEPDLIEFQGSIGSAQITKTYTIPKERNGPYCFNLDIRVDGDARGLWLSSGVPDVEIVSNSYSPLLRIQVTKNKLSEVDTIDLPKKGAGSCIKHLPELDQQLQRLFRRHHGSVRRNPRRLSNCSNRRISHSHTPHPHRSCL